MRSFFLLFLGLFYGSAIAQCPETQLFDLDLTVSSDNPTWINCIDNSASPDDFSLELISPNDIRDYQIDWGDGSPIELGVLWTAGTSVAHNYVDLGNYTVTLTEVQNGCSNTITGTLISDRKPGATARPPTDNSNGCVPQSLTFLNESTNISRFTEFVWDWGDGSFTVVTNGTDPGAVGVPIDHVFLPGVSGCGMQVKLTARSLCDTSFVIYGPYDFYDIDTADVSASNTQICVGDSILFNDITDYNCIPGTRRVRWDLSDFGGGVTDWLPAIPANRSRKFFVDGPVGSTFDIALEDSNFCGIDRDFVTVEIIAPPTAVPVVVDDSICQGTNAQFENLSTGGANSYEWGFGDGEFSNTNNTQLTNHVYSDSGAFTVQLIADVAGSLLCKDSAEVQIFVNPEPIISFTSTTDISCDTIESVLENTTLGLVTWSWDLGNGLEQTDQNEVTFSSQNNGFFPVSLTGENAFSCISTKTDTFLVVPKPKIDINPDSLCFGEVYQTINETTIDDFPSGTFISEQFLNLSNTSSIDDLLLNPNYPNSPDQSILLTEFDIPDGVLDNSGNRIQALIKPEKSGTYKFFVAANDFAVLNLSTDDKPINKVEIASAPGFTNPQEWTKFPEQESEFITLDSGRYYYIEAINKNGIGTTHISVGWQLPDGQLERPISGSYITPFFPGLIIEDYEWSFGDGSQLSNENSPNHTFSGSGDFQVSLTASTSVCESKDSVIVSVAREIDSNLVFLDTAGCSPFLLEVIDSSNVSSLTFIYGDGERDTINHVLGDTSRYEYFNNTLNSKFFNYSAVLKDSFNCELTVEQMVEVFAIPAVDLTLDLPLPACAPFNLIASNADFNSFLTYEWGYGDSLIVADSSFTLEINNNSTNLRFDTVSLSVVNGEGCPNSIERSFSVFPKPNYNMQIEPDSGCSPLVVQLSLDAGAQSYLWDFGDGLFSNLDRPVHEYTLTTQDTITYFPEVSVVSPFSCPDTVSGAVFVQKNISASFLVSPKEQTYPDTTVQILALNQGPVTDTLWKIGNEEIQGGLLEYAFDTIGQHIISQTVTNDFCESTFSDTINILPPVPQAFFDGGGTGCVFADFNFTNQSKFATEFFWDFGDGNTSMEENPTHIYEFAGVYDVTLKVVGPGGEDSLTVFQNVTTVLPPTSDFNVLNDTVYQPDSVFQFLNQSSGMISERIWISGNGDTLFAGGNQVEFSYGDVNEYEVSLVVSNGFDNCYDTSKVKIYVLPPLPIASFTGSDTSCTPLTVDFMNTSVNSLIYRWDFGDGNESFQENPSHTYDSVGVFNVKLVATNLLGSDSTVSLSVVRVLEKPLAQFEFLVDTLNYPDTSFVVDNLSSGNITTYIWSSENDTDTIVNDPSYTFKVDGIGPGILNLNVENEFENCTASFSDTAFVRPPIPIADFNAFGKGCAPLTVSFTNESIFGATYLWDLGNGNFSNSENPSANYFLPGVYDVKLTVFNSSGVDSVLKTGVIEVYENPSALYVTNPSNDQELVAPVDVFFSNQSRNADSFLWDFGDGSISTEERPLHSYSEEGVYQTSLVATTEFGCKDSFNLAPAITVINGGLFVIPNAFSPNTNGPSSTGDISEGMNNNDIFFPKIKGDVQEYKLFIYDRWGELLFLSEDPYIGWDGYFNGRLSKQDVYVYRLEIQFQTGESETKIGDFSLIR